jgi:hypothetical protein
MKVRATALTAGTNTPPELQRIEYAPSSLSISVAFEESIVAVSFASTVGYRVFDEGDLLEFWPTCSCVNGWIWQIHAGGWFDLESTRPTFISEKYKTVNEYLIVGDNECVNVLSHDRPHLGGNAL